MVDQRSIYQRAEAARKLSVSRRRPVTRECARKACLLRKTFPISHYVNRWDAWSFADLKSIFPNGYVDYRRIYPL